MAALAIVKESDFPTLNSILFGEGVVNDAVAILIFKSVEKMIEAGQEEVDEDIIDTTGVKIGAKEIGQTVKDFFILTISSLALGIAVGLISAFVLKHVKSLHHHPVLEIFLIMLFGYSSYLIAEIASLSGIMCLFFCGVIMSHYTYHNISTDSKLGSVVTISTMSFAAEAFLFTYLGMSIFSTESSSFSLTFTFLIILAAVISRFASVFISIAIYALFKRCVIEINCKQLMLIWFSGLIRGAIAFALSLEISDKIAPHRDQMVSTTLMMVLMTTVVLGGIMSAFTKLIGLETEAPEEEDMGTHDAQIERFSDIIFNDKKRSWLQTKFHLLDDKILKPCFGGDLSKREKHEQERKIEEERRTQYLKIEAIRKNNRQTENAVMNSYSKDLLSNSGKGKGSNRNTQFDDKSQSYMKGSKLDMIAEDEEDD